MKWKILFFCVLLACIFSLFFLIAPPLRNNKGFTELSFDEHKNLPDKIELKKNYEIYFTIHNLEKKRMVYTYAIASEIDGNKEMIKLDYITLEHDQAITLFQDFSIRKEFRMGKITVELLNKEQEIHFWVTRA